MQKCQKRNVNTVKSNRVVGSVEVEKFANISAEGNDVKNVEVVKYASITYNGQGVKNVMEARYVNTVK